jgi:hypothetical protein
VAHFTEALRPSLRRLTRRPGLTAAVVLILGLGIGISTAVFSVVRRVLLHPIPVAELNRLVGVGDRWVTRRFAHRSRCRISRTGAPKCSFDDLAAAD